MPTAGHMKDVDLMISILELISEAERILDESDNMRERFPCLFTEHDWKWDADLVMRSRQISVTILLNVLSSLSLIRNIWRAGIA